MERDSSLTLLREKCDNFLTMGKIENPCLREKVLKTRLETSVPVTARAEHVEKKIKPTVTVVGPDCSS